MKKEYFKPIIEAVALPTQGTQLCLGSPQQKPDTIDIHFWENEGDETVDDFEDLL